MTIYITHPQDAPLPSSMPLSSLDKWDQRFVDLANHVRAWSKDPNNTVGAVLVGLDHRQVALGYNGPPPGLNDRAIMRMAKEEKNAYTLHAERNVLDNAHFPKNGSTLYSTRALCPHCACSMVSVGVQRVVCPLPEANSTWFEEQLRAFAVLIDAGIEVTKYRYKTKRES